MFLYDNGLHGLHVIVGTIFIIVCYFRLCHCHFSSRRHLGFEMAIWYWHFVDVIWILVYFLVYWWSNTATPPIYDILV